MAKPLSIVLHGGRAFWVLPRRLEMQESADSMSMKLLVCESDTRSWRMRYRDFLEQNYFSVRTAGGGAMQCIAELRRGLPDLLLLDAELKWGGVDGVLHWLC